MKAAQNHQTGTSRISAGVRFFLCGGENTTGNLTKDAGVKWQLHR